MNAIATYSKNLEDVPTKYLRKQSNESYLQRWTCVVETNKQQEDSNGCFLYYKTKNWKTQQHRYEIFWAGLEIRNKVIVV